MTLRRAIVRWLVFARNGKAETTRLFYRETALTLFRECRHALALPVAELTEEKFQSLATRFGHLCPSRWNAILQCLHSLSPAAKVLKRRPIKLTRQPPPNQTEFATLLAECDKLTKSKAGLVIDFLAHTGLRITAARNVKWSDVYDDRVEYIAKGGRRCSVPIIAGLRPVLDRLRAIRDGSEFVLPQGAIVSGLRRACKAAGIRQLSHHDFRHMFITRCIESGVDAPTLARWVGHRDGGALLSKRYFHLLNDHSRTMAAKVSILPAAQSAPTVAPLQPATLVYAMPSLNFTVVAA